VVAYIVRRILWAGVLVVAMTFVTFVILYKIPNDPARFLVPNQNPTEHQLEVAREQLGIDDPIVMQYGRDACGVHGWAHHMVLPWITISVLRGLGSTSGRDRPVQLVGDAVGQLALGVREALLELGVVEQPQR
jgi:Binding-prot-dependent transport system membrane comp, N-term